MRSPYLSLFYPSSSGKAVEREKLREVRYTANFEYLEVGKVLV